MKKFLIILISSLFLSYTANAEIKIEKNVTINDKYVNLTVENPDFFRGNSPNMYIIWYSYSLNHNNPKINEFTKNINEKNFSIEKDNETEFIIVQIFPEKGDFSETLPIIINNSNGSPLKNSYYLKSLYEVNALSNFNNPNINYFQSANDIEEELKYHPNNIIALLTKFSMNKTSNILDDEVNKLIKNPDILSEKELILLHNIYKADKKDKNAENIAKLILKKFPLGSFSEQDFYTKLSNKKGNEYLQLADLFLKQYPNSNKYSEIIDKIAQIYIDNNKLENAKNILESNNFIPPYQSLRLAFAFLEKRNNRNDAEKMFESIITRLKNKNSITKNSKLSLYQWNINLNEYLAETYRAYGEYFLQTKAPKRAIDYLLLAKDYFQNPPAKLYENLAIAFYNSQLDEEALNITEQAFTKGFDSKIINDINERTFNYVHRNKEYSKYIDSLTYESKIIRLNSLYKKLINENIKLPALRNQDDIIVDLSLMRKDILVIELFSSWCEPCENSLLSFSEINNSLKSGTNISMIAINTFENQNLDKKIFNIKDLSNLQVFFDTDGDFARSLGISGLPVRLFIDKLGQLRYIQNGAIGKEEDIRETKDVMELLNNLQ